MRDRIIEGVTWLGIIGMYLGAGVFDHDIWAPVEPTMAGVVWGMSDDGDLAVPRINGEYPFLEKPPLYYWLSLGSAKLLGGLSPGALRLPVVLLGLFCLLAVFWIARREYGSSVASLAAVLGATTGMFWDMAHRAATDVAGTTFAFLAFAVFARSFWAPDDASRRRWDLVLAVTLIASFYAKNLFTAFVVLPLVAVALLRQGEFARLGRIALIGGVGGVIACLPWVVALYASGGWEYVRMVFIDNTLGRFLTLDVYRPEWAGTLNDAYSAEKEPLFFYLPRILAYPLPWTPIVLLALWRIYLRRDRWTDLQSFIALGFVGVPLILSISSAKSTDYLAPILFFGFLLLSDFFREWLDGPERLPRWQRRLVVGNLAVVGGVLAILPLGLAPFAGSLWLALLGLGAAAIFWPLLSRLRFSLPDGGWLARYAAATTAALFLCLSFGVPALDPIKNFRPFFSAIRPHLEGRMLVTTFLDASRLPLMNYYLERSVPVIRTRDLVRVVSLDIPVAVIMSGGEYEQARADLADIPGIYVVDEGGGNRYRLVGNVRPD